MLDRLAEYARCFEDPENWAVATAISVAGSSPAPVGTSMAVSRDMEIIGSLSAGCAESAVAVLAQECIISREPVREVFSPDGERMGSVALTCGGTLEVLIEPLTSVSELEALKQLSSQDPRERASITRHVPKFGLDLSLHRPAAPRLILSGAHDYSAALAQIALQSGWRVNLVDLRRDFATTARLPIGTDIRLGHPPFVIRELLENEAQEGSFTAVCVMTHHPDLDVPVLDSALRTPETAVHFVGAMGSRRASSRRNAALERLGHSDEERRRVHSPLGLDIQAATPAETAVSMFAEIIAAKNAASARGASFSMSEGPLHRHRPEAQSIVVTPEAHLTP